jgi:hypothetical protein
MFQQPPRIVEYGTHDIIFRHYGKSIELMIEAVCEIPDGPKRPAGQYHCQPYEEIVPDMES